MSLFVSLSLSCTLVMSTLKNFTLHTKNGIVFNSHIINYSNSIGFMTQADKKNFFDFIKNNNGYLSFGNDVSINFSIKGKAIKFSKSKSKLIKSVKDMDNILMNLLIEK